MNRRLLLLSLTIFSLNALAQDIYPSNKTISTLEKNILFNSQKRRLVEQTGTGTTTTSKLDVNELFNGSFLPSYTAAGIVDSIAITIHDVTTYHTQSGTWVGWSTRAWQPTKFRIEIYNTYNNANTWVTIVDTVNYNKTDYLKKLTNSVPNKVRFTFYNAAGPGNQLGISELFMIHPEAGQAYDSFLPKYDKNMNVVLGTPTSTPDSTQGDLAIYAKNAPDNRASLKIGYDASNNLEIYRDRTVADIYLKANQTGAPIRFVTNAANFTFNGGKVGVGTTTPGSTFDVWGVSGISTMAVRSIGGLIGEHSGIVFQDGRSKIGYDGTYFGLMLATSDNSKPIVFGNALAAGTGETMRLTGPGSLGIGTNLPTSKLHATLSTTTGAAIGTFETVGTGGRPFIKFKAENSDYGVIGYTSTGGGDFMNIYNTRNAALQFGTNNINRMTITSTGNVGIGTYTSPSYKLDVNGDIRINKGSALRLFRGDSATVGLNLYAGSSNNFIHSQNGSLIYISSGAISLDATSGHNFRSADGATTYMSISNTGNIGIGTSSLNVLDVNTGVSAGYGNYALIRTSPSTGYRGGLLLSNSASSSVGTSFKMTSSFNGSSSATTRFGFVANTDTETFMNSGAALEFFYNGNVALGHNGGNVLLAQGSGNVGVGTNSIPSGYKMAVAGSIIAEKIKVKKRVGGTWPDYVFSPDYKLPNLEEVEKFTKENSHLPEIPSAKEIEKEGQDLGEMNRLLLKKIEELTLYMIEQNKEIKVLKSKVEQLEKNN